MADATYDLTGFFDDKATLLHVVAASWDGTDRLCGYCLPDENGHGDPITTGIRSPRWGTWETCCRCAKTQLATLHGMRPTGPEEQHSVRRAAIAAAQIAAAIGTDSREATP